MVDIIFDPLFKKKLAKFKHRGMKLKIMNQLKKIRKQPKVGKPMKHKRKGTRELYISPFRISYCLVNDKIYVLDLYHKDEQ